MVAEPRARRLVLRPCHPVDPIARPPATATLVRATQREDTKGDCRRRRKLRPGEAVCRTLVAADRRRPSLAAPGRSGPAGWGEGVSLPGVGLLARCGPGVMAPQVMHGCEPCGAGPPPSRRPVHDVGQGREHGVSVPGWAGINVGRFFFYFFQGRICLPSQFHFPRFRSGGRGGGCFRCRGDGGATLSSVGLMNWPRSSHPTPGGCRRHNHDPTLPSAS